MTLDQELEPIARQYRDEGYAVVVRPRVEDLPAFATGFSVDLLATRGTERVLVRVKHNRSALESDHAVPEQAEVTNRQPGWRFDLVLLTANDPNGHRSGEPSREEIEQMLGEADTVVRAGTPRAGFILAWAGLEAAMRRVAQRAGFGGAPGTPPPTLIRELYAAGRISPDDFQRIDGMRHLRTEVVHGLAPTTIDAKMVQSLIEPARRLLAESEPVNGTAG